jgi:CheY-like chemotaxis protein
MPEAATTRPRALVVDDNADSAETFARLLDSYGLEAIFTTDPRQALVLAERSHPRIAFLDIGMPFIDGYALAGLLRQRFGHAALCLVAVTGYDRSEHRQRSRAAGFDALVAKPADIEVIRSILRGLFPELRRAIDS